MRAFSLLPLMLLTLATPVTSSAQSVYKCVEPSGTVVYSETPCASDPADVQTIDTSDVQKFGSDDALAEQGEFVRMNDIRRQCDERTRSIQRRYAAEYARISSKLADLDQRIKRIDYRLIGTPAQTELKSQIAPLKSTRDTLEASESQELTSAAEQCRSELAAENQRQSAAQAARAEAKRAAERAAAAAAAEDKRRAEEAAKKDQDARSDGLP